MKQWQEQGCPTCRKAWESGQRDSIRYIGISFELHGRLYQCSECNAYWEELERFAHEISSDEAQAFINTATFEEASNG